MPPNAKSRAAPGRPALLTSPTAKQAEVVSRLAAVDDVAGDLTAWGSTVLHLHSLGLPAAVPEFPAAWLRRHGVFADWVTAA
jgi:hypothetical protein